VKVTHTDLEGLVVFEPTPHRDERGYFTPAPWMCRSWPTLASAREL
jgi:dTDP-4-dehydrorhamnose 3,5-epimerase-like enzyme